MNNKKNITTTYVCWREGEQTGSGGEHPLPFMRGDGGGPCCHSSMVVVGPRHLSLTVVLGTGRHLWTFITILQSWCWALVYAGRWWWWAIIAIHQCWCWAHVAMCWWWCWLLMEGWWAIIVICQWWWWPIVAICLSQCWALIAVCWCWH